MARRNEHYYMTGAQEAYLRRLLNEAFARHYSPGWIIRDWHRVSKEDASKHIDQLVRAKNRGWTPEPRKDPTGGETYAHFGQSDGRRGTCLARAWPHKKSRDPSLVLLKVGPFDPAWSTK